ncbi:MAG: 4-hydroxythreonine-4-phosphate dehydrogenase PdxA [Desulfobacteraceae bacterium]|nr:4-hydroxythreonine-4-phosphate dehydrogenase PdxA [Desulfobacteraceae bacterium]MBC2754570.1 4-hydroxythreonine-4-phosphate dehydrogenase PdxA [Desulfobacteraceae bacterium]
MGDPVGIGPELICLALNHSEVYDVARPLVIGDVQVLETAKLITKIPGLIATINSPGAASYKPGCIDVVNSSHINPETLVWGQPTEITGKAMEHYIITAINMALNDDIAAIVTCPINKTALKLAGSQYHGHTELLADQTGTAEYAMMMAGDRLRVVLVTIHMSLKQVPQSLTIENIMSTIETTDYSLKERFGFERPKIAVAGLNPHSGEAGMFGDEEARIIEPAVNFSKKNGIDVSGPYPPDTVFVNAMNGEFDAVVCMYHDQGLIPFKMIHFSDGVNTTLGLPIIRTSVDHGTAYDIAGKAVADPGSLIQAIRLAANQAICRIEKNYNPA